jgi:hypothetical protein
MHVLVYHRRELTPTYIALCSLRTRQTASANVAADFVTWVASERYSRPH